MSYFVANIECGDVKEFIIQSNIENTKLIEVIELEDKNIVLEAYDYSTQVIINSDYSCQETNSCLTGSILLTEGSNIPSANTINNYSIDNGALFKISGTIASNITGIANGVSGRYIIIVNNTNQDQTLHEESLSSSASNRFVLGVSNKIIGINQTATLVYLTGLTIDSVGSQSRWVLTATT
jgi:hypothetical protein